LTSLPTRPLNIADFQSAGPSVAASGGFIATSAFTRTARPRAIPHYTARLIRPLLFLSHAATKLVAEVWRNSSAPNHPHAAALHIHSNITGASSRIGQHSFITAPLRQRHSRYVITKMSRLSPMSQSQPAFRIIQYELQSPSDGHARCKLDVGDWPTPPGRGCRRNFQWAAIRAHAPGLASHRLALERQRHVLTFSSRFWSLRPSWRISYPSSCHGRAPRLTWLDPMHS
jgi:hypothetical protein